MVCSLPVSMVLFATQNRVKGEWYEQVIFTRGVSKAFNPRSKIKYENKLPYLPFHSGCKRKLSPHNSELK